MLAVEAAAQTALQFKEGDSAATKAVRVRVQKILFFKGFGFSEEDKRDLEQVILLDLWQAVTRSQFEPSGFWGLVEVVSARRCIDALRARKRHVPFADQATSLDGASDPLSLILEREQVEIATAILEYLPENCRELIELRIREGKTYADIAKILGRSAGALRVQMHRCIKHTQDIRRDLMAGNLSRNPRSGGGPPKV